MNAPNTSLPKYLTMDTSAFDRAGKRFKGKLGAILDEASEHASLVITSVTLMEMKDHLRRELLVNRQKFRNAFKSMEGWMGLWQNDCKIWIDEFQIDEAVQSFFGSFIEQFQVKIVECEDLNVPKLMEMYFQNRGAFSILGTKKNEFPDAIALMSLSKFLDEQTGEIICISYDKDWKKYAEEIDQRIKIEDFEGVFKLFNGISVGIRNEIIQEIEKVDQEYQLERSIGLSYILNRFLSRKIAQILTHKFGCDYDVDLELNTISLDSLNFVLASEDEGICAKREGKYLFGLNINGDFEYWGEVSKRYKCKARDGLHELVSIENYDVGGNAQFTGRVYVEVPENQKHQLDLSSDQIAVDISIQVETLT